jgi:hypothetical protein
MAVQLPRERYTVFGRFPFLAATDLFPVDVGAVHAAEIAEGGFRRASFEQKVMAGDLRVIRQAEVAILHAAEQEVVVFGEFEDTGGAVGVEGAEVDGGHGVNAKRLK